MTQTESATRSPTVNTLVLDTETGAVVPDAGFAGVPLEAIMKNIVNGNKTHKAAPLAPEASSKSVRAHNGENSVTPWDITITNNTNGATIVSTGITEVGETTVQPQYKGVSVSALLYHLGGVADCPLHKKFIDTLVTALVMENTGSSAEDIAAHYAENEIQWAPSTKAKNDLNKRVRTSTMAETAGKVLITRD